MVSPGVLSINSRGGGMATPITGSAADRLAWCANLRLWFFRERHAQCSQLTGDASTSWACCSPRHKAQAAWVSAPAILLPQVHGLAGGLFISMERLGTSFVFFLLAPVKKVKQLVWWLAVAASCGSWCLETAQPLKLRMAVQSQVAFGDRVVGSLCERI